VQSGTWQEWDCAGQRSFPWTTIATATAAVLDQTEEEKFLTFTPSDEDLEKAADGTPWAQTNTCVQTICFSEQSVRKAVVAQPINR